MPIAFAIVMFASLLMGWYEHNIRAHAKEELLRMESRAVAANMIMYRQQIVDYAQYNDAGGTAVNWTLFSTYTGDAAAFITTVKDTGQVPATMTWYPGPLPGVLAYIESGGVITLSYKQPGPENASDRGVQYELLKFTNNSLSVGRVN